MTNLLCVALGGAFGAVLRYLVSMFMGSTAKGVFPWATFTVNVVGCLVIGLLSVALTSQGESPRIDHLRLLCITGVCGGFTTFSTFGRESLTLLQEGHNATFAIYALGSLGAGLAAVALGAWMARQLA